MSINGLCLWDLCQRSIAPTEHQPVRLAIRIATRPAIKASYRPWWR